MRPPNIGLRSKIILYVSCLIIAIIAINAAITIRTERKEREAQLMEQGKLFAALTATDVVRSYGSLSWSGGYQPTPATPPEMQMARFFSYYPDLVRLMVISHGGIVLFDSSDPAAAGRQAKTSDQAVISRLSTQEVDARTLKDKNGEKFIDIMAPVSGPGGPQFLKVRYIMSYRSLEERLKNIRNDFLILTGLFIFIGIVGAAIFSAKLTSPILRLKDGASELERGNFDLEVDIHTKDELGELGRSFNRMATALSEQRTDLEELNNNLIEANEELVELQGELIRSERMAAVGELAAGLSHEIDNPIGVILGFAELMLEDIPEDDPRHDDLSTIVSEAKRCKRIVRGLLDFSRPPVLGVIMTDIGEVIRHTADSAQRIFKKARLVVELDGSAPDILADPDRLRQVFMNLLINAVQAMPDGGEITIREQFDAEAGELLVTVTDTGHGIPREDLEKVFEPFYTTKKPGEGTGLGLAICARLIEEQGGRIMAESEPGQGASFTVILPVRRPGEAQEDGQAGPPDNLGRLI
jgi:signal transduction histidine kinase